jgi:histidine triad (HIT) family protein
MNKISIPGGGFAGGKPRFGSWGDSPKPCAFCLIVDGQAEADIVLETENLVAFLDQRPVFKGHVLLVPRAHLVTLLDLPEDLYAEWTSTQQRLMRAVMDELGAEGAFVANNNVVSQSVPHLHQHVVPRTKGDGLRGFFWPRRTYADGEAAEYADRLRTALA